MFHPASAARAVGDRDPEVARLLREWQDMADGDPRDGEVVAAMTAALNLRVTTHWFDHADRFGRRIAVEVSEWEAAGDCYARARGLRGGRAYGSATAVREFTSGEAREAWCERYVKTARRRALARSGR